MELYLYMLRHGSRKTKMMLWGILLLFLASLSCLIVGIAIKGFFLGSAGFMVMIFSIVLLASISFQKIEQKEQAKKEEKEKRTVQKERGQEKLNKPGSGEVLSGAEDFFDGTKQELTAEEEEELKKRIEEEEKFTYLQAYDEKKLKKLLSKGGAKNGHETVMIDSWKKEGIYQSPAYVWKEKDKVVFLVLLKETRKISVSVDKIKKVYYEKGVEVDINSDYSVYNGTSWVSMVFAPFLPGYYDKFVNGHAKHCKNLYVMDPGIKFTNTSAKGLFTVLGIDFPMEDEVSRSKKFDAYFIRAYHYQLLLRDNAMSMDAYRELLAKQMEKMSHTSMEFQELVEVLRRMMEYKVVSKELANQCLDDYRTIRYERERNRRR